MFQPDYRIPSARVPLPTPISPYPSFPPPVNGGELAIDRAGYARNITTDRVLNGQFDITNATQDAFYATSTGGAWQGPAGVDPNMAFYNQAIAPTLNGANRTMQYALSQPPQQGGEGGAAQAPPKKGSLLKDVAGFAAVGAVAGNFIPIPGVGAGIGAAVGGAVGAVKNFLFG